MTSLFIYYYDWAQAWKVDLGNQVLRLGDIAGLSEIADNLDAGSSGLSFDDPNANIGHSSDAIVGLKFIGLDEMACAVGNRRLYTGLIGDRKYTHSTNRDGSLRIGSARTINVDMREVNAVAGLRLIRQSDTTAKRPAESVGDRLTWILGSTYLSDLVVDGGLVVYPPAPTMDANDYRQQRPADVIADCAVACGYTAFLYHDDERWTKARLFFDDFLRSSAYASTLRLSNVLSDVDSNVIDGVGPTGTFASGPATLVRSPERVYSGVSISFRKGTAFRTKASTATTFLERDGTAPNANVKTRERAQDIGDRFLNENDTEYDQIITSVELPLSAVNSIRRGHLISGKWSHLPGYTSFTELRILSRSIATKTPTDDRYTLNLTLTPTIAAVACDPDTATDRALGATCTGYTSNSTAPAPTNTSNATDGDDNTNTGFLNALIDPAYTGTTIIRAWDIDLGAAYRIGFVDIRKRISDHYPEYVAYSSSAGGPYTEVTATQAGLTDGLTGIWRWTITTPPTARYWRVGHAHYMGGGLPYGFSFFGGYNVDGIEILECPA